MDVVPQTLVKTKEGFRAVLQSTGQDVQATILDSSIPRCIQVKRVPVVFNYPYTAHNLYQNNVLQWHPSHVQLLPVGDTSVLFIGQAGLRGGGHSCSKCATYYCDRCHYYCPNGRCYDYCTHRQDHNCASRQAAQRREQAERERQERERQERQRQEQERLRQQREQEQRERERQEQQRREEQERQARLRQQREQEQRERERQERIARERRQQEQRERELQERRREQEERQARERQQQEQEQREKERQERIAAENLRKELARLKQERIIQDRREKAAIKYKLQQTLQQTTAILEDEQDYVSEEETEECRGMINQDESRAVQQEGPIEATETDYGNWLPQHKIDETRLLFEALNLSDAAPTEYTEKRCNEGLIPESWYKRLEILETNSSNLIETTLMRLESNMSEDFNRLAQYAIDKEKSRKNYSEIFEEEFAPSGKPNYFCILRNREKLSRIERRRELIAQNVKHKAFVQLSKVVRRNVRKVGIDLQQQIMEYVHRGGKLQTRVIKRFPVVRWIEQSLIFELIAYPDGKVDEVLLNVFKNHWMIVRELFERQDRQKLLYALRTEQLIRGLTLQHINDVLDMVTQVKFIGLDVVCKRGENWYFELKKCWVKSKIPEYNNAETSSELVELLVSLPWNSLMTQQFLNAIVGEPNQLVICDFLYKVRNEHMCHPIVMDIVAEKSEHNNGVAGWTSDLNYHILIQEIYKLNPEVGRHINSKLRAILRKSSTAKLLNFLRSNTSRIAPNMDKFVRILENTLMFQTTPDVWDDIETIINSERNTDKWEQKVDNFIVSSIFGKSYEYSVDELLDRMSDCTLHPTNFDRNKVLRAFNSVKAAYNSKLKSSHIGHWADSVKLNFENSTLEEKIAVVIRAVEFSHEFKPRDSQILSLLVLLMANEDHGRLAQINTGEGKSIIVAMLAVIHALKGVKVDIVTTSTELSIPEVKKQRPFFEIFGLTVDENSPDRDKKVVYRCDIVYGTASDFQGDVLRTEFLGNDCRGNRKHQVIIVDEVDSMLFDSRTHSVRLSDENPGMTHLEVPLAVIWHQIHNINAHMIERDNKVFFITEDFEAVGNEIKLYSGEDWETVSTEVHDKKEFITTHTENHLRKLLRKLTVDEQKEYEAYQALNLRIMGVAEQLSKANDDEKMKAECEQMRLDLIKLPWNTRDPVVDIPEHLRSFALNQISIWVKNAILAKWVYKKDAHYTVIHGKIIPVNFNETGDLQTNMIWSDGLTQFLQLKEGLRMDPEGISTNFISNISFFQRYGSNIYGLTGTLGEQSTQDFLQTMYGTDMIVIPPYKTTDITNNEMSGYRCKELAPLVLCDVKIWYQSVKENALYHAQNNRAVLVICKFITQARNIANMLRKVHDPRKIFIYTGEETKFEKNAVDSGEIIVATNIAGRGTDIKTSKNVEKHGGMCVLVTFLPESFRVEMQNVGRTAREGKRGMAQLITYDVGNLPMESLKKMRQEREAKAITAAINDAKKMLIQDCLFSRFCLLENELLPSMDETRKMHVWDLLNAGWIDYSANHLDPRKISEKATMWAEKSHQEFVSAALKSLSRAERGKLTEQDMQDLRSQATKKVAEEMPAFKKRYAKNVWNQYCTNQSSLVQQNQLDAFRNGQKFNPKCSELASRYGWGTFERKALEESWGLWLKSKLFDDDETSAEEAIVMFRNEFEDTTHQRAALDKLVRNPFFYVLKGNEQLNARHFENAIKCYDRAIDLDPVFSANARYCKAQTLLSYSENKGTKQQDALNELRKAEDLIKSVYRPNLLTFNTLIGQHQCLEQTSQHVQHQLDILSQQEDYIRQAREVIEMAQKNNNNVKVTLKNLYDVLSEAKEDHAKAIREAYGNGLKNLFTVEEKLPRPWGSIVAVALIGVAQIAAGCLIVMYTGGSLGTGLIAEGVADLIVAATAAIKGTFSWAAWATQKVVSIAVSIVCSGIASIKQTAKEAGNLGIGTIKQAGKNMLKGFKSGLKDVSRTCYDIGKGIATPQGGLGLAIKEVGLALGKGVVKECLNEAGKYCTNQVFMNKLEEEITTIVSDVLIRALSSNALVVKALEEDERNGSSYWKQLFIKEGMELLKDKEINKCADMFKSIAKGVAVGSIPYAGSVMDVAGVGKCVYTLNTYTENFITKFNKKVSSHEKSINEQRGEASKSNLSEKTEFSNGRNNNQAFNQNVTSAPDMDCENSDIDVHQVTEDAVYSSKVSANAQLRSTYREASTPKTLANVFKGTITGKLTTSIQENIINPALSHVSSRVANGLFANMEESVTKLRHEIKTERDNRSESNAMANSAMNETPIEENQDLGPETTKMIEMVTKDDHLHDTTSLALSAGAINAPIYVYDEKGKLKYIVGSKLPGKPINIKHFAPSKDHPVGHFTPLDPNLKVTPSGTNSCAIDAVVAQLSSTQKESLQVNNAADLRNKMVQQIKNNPRQAEQMYEKRAQLERIAPHRIFNGGREPQKQPKLDKRVSKFNKKFETYQPMLGDRIRRDSDSMDNAMTNQTQEHHLIHQSLRNHRAITETGFNIHDPINVLVCPRSEEDRRQLGTNRSVHCGRHPTELVAEIRTKLDEAWRRHSEDRATLKRVVYEIAYKERELVRSGERSLQR
ncbi:uncharacterized protein LOC109402566 [Aedes albopictus]|uniref:Protein translocase subunit SecA n=1 Tax=Aedes albopictus TaxID=7160 RepID=A0ABM1Y3C6_AEDAL